MTVDELKELLIQFKLGQIDESDVIELVQKQPFQDLGHTKIDTHRELRRGFPEVVYGEGKTVNQIRDIALTLKASGSTVLITRLTEETFLSVQTAFPELIYHADARCASWNPSPTIRGRGTILVISAGTSDIPVAEEAAVSAEVMGNKVERIYDIGVSGVHRLLKHFDQLRQAEIVIAVAGMEGALPSVVSGLIDRPVIGVPTSVGYGANFFGISALLSMLNSCSSGVLVVNINNGFGAAYAASLINQRHN
jgi:pyridinium-3,5-biscarboxylic acid mononucleotide synthase